VFLRRKAEETELYRFRESNVYKVTAHVETGSSHLGFVVNRAALGQVFSEYIGFPGSSHLGFVMDRAALGQVSSEYIGFPGPNHMGFVVDRAALGQVSSEYIGFPGSGHMGFVVDSGIGAGFLRVSRFP
jgi:hypothetical protein